jgi:plasmid stabilization system protein ParE
MVMKLEWSPRAEKDTKRIFDYIKSHAGETIARKIVGKIQSRPNLLKSHPRGGQREFSLEGLPVEYRKLVVGNYKIIYFIDDPGSTVVIATVFDTRQNPIKLRQIIMRRLS